MASSGNIKASSMSPSTTTFKCHMYISARDRLAFALPAEPGPMRVARFEALDYDELIDPSFRRLLAAFESVRDSSNTAPCAG